MLKIQSDRVIIDGHEPTKEQCETMTLLANALAESENFKTVKYESGYAEFEKVGKADKLKFAPGGGKNLSINFDEGIEKVVYLYNYLELTDNATLPGNAIFYEYTVSDSSQQVAINDGVADKATCGVAIYFKNGYTLNTLNAEYLGPYTGIKKNNGTALDAPVYGFTNSVNNSLTAITVTSKLAVSRKSVDLTTLPGWSSLSSGSHSITIVAKADGYRDSEPSATVSVEKAPQEYTDCITFTGESSDFTLAVGSNGAKEWDGTVEYSTDHNTWTTWNGTAISSVDKKLYLRGSGNTTFYTDIGAKLSLSARAACSGNIQTLLEYSNPPTSIPASNCYNVMFRNCTNLTQAPALPATTLTNNCYYYMFGDCTSLTQAPELPAVTLAVSCYNGMFSGCTSLTQAPALPATTLTNSCYNNMFFGCTSLTQAPELPAATLAGSCYFFMFYGCTSLKISATRSSRYPTAWRIPSSGTISSTATNWNASMLAGTGGKFTSDPSINTTYYGAWGASVSN